MFLHIMLLKTQNLSFINSSNFLNTIFKKQSVITESNKSLLLSITIENTNVGCILDNYISSPIFFDNQNHSQKYSYISLVEGTFKTYKSFKLEDPKFLNYKFHETFFFNRSNNSLVTTNLKAPIRNLQVNLFFRNFILYKPTKGGFFGYWFGFFGYISKRSCINALKYFSKKFNRVLWYFSIIFNYIRLYSKLVSKKCFYPKFDFRIYFNSIFYFR